MSRYAKLLVIVCICYISGIQQLIAKDKEMFRYAVPSDKHCQQAGSYVVASHVGVNQFAQYQHLDQIYFSMFAPNATPVWQGNLKRYAIDYATGQILDKNQRSATRVSKGVGPVIDRRAHSFWPEPAGHDRLPKDGNKVLSGGARALWDQEQLVLEKKLLNYAGAYRTQASTGWASIPSDDHGWLIPITNQAIPNWGAPLHSRPLLVNYGYDEHLNSETPSNSKRQWNAVFVSTNTGWLHAVSANRGTALFSFLPHALELPSEFAATQVLQYGLDSTWVAWKRHQQVSLYAGMRRGGSNYYALDVTEAGPDVKHPKPRLAFVLHGGVSAPKASPYRLLGQTWSIPVLAYIRVQRQGQATVVPVMIFTGGYDARVYDQYPWQLQRLRALGAGIFIVDARTGELIWWSAASGSMADHSSLTHSMVTSVKPLDLNRDGLIDRFYAVDIAGQVFRVVLDNGTEKMAKSPDKLGRVVRIADVSSHMHTPRHFFTTPSVGLVQSGNGQVKVAIALGSGLQHDWQDRRIPEAMFVLFDSIHLPKQPLSVITAEQLPVLNMQNPEGVQGADSARGWRLDLGQDGHNAGEKLLSSPLLFNHLLWFVTHIPQPVAESNTKCASAQRHWGRSRLYAIAVGDGSARSVFRRRMVGEIAGSGRYVERSDQGATVNELQVLMGPDGRSLLKVGTQLLRFGEELSVPGVSEVRTLGWQRLNR